MKINLRLLYLYLFSFVGLLIVVVGSIRMVNLGLKTVVFPEVDTYEIYPTPLGEKAIDPEVEMARQKRETNRQRQRELAESLSFVIVGLPVYLYHWRTIQKEKLS